MGRSIRWPTPCARTVMRVRSRDAAHETPLTRRRSRDLEREELLAQVLELDLEHPGGVRPEGHGGGCAGSDVAHEVVAVDVHLVGDVAVHGQAHLLTGAHLDRKSTRLNSSHSSISYAVFCLKKKN